ncbi:MAG: hypothetical protein QGF00_26985 [Planctomycetota bacterium]|nr:hypothetical protein [Planctomycetota bacterium]
MKIWRENLPHQTIGFGMPDLPGQTFRLVVPELISDSRNPILPWSTPSPDWEVGEESARCVIEIVGMIRMSAEVLFSGDRIVIDVSVSNLSEEVWEKANLFTCFAYYAAPLYDDPDLSRTYLPVATGRWKAVADLFAEHDPGPGPYTFFPVRDGPALSDLWICRTINQSHPQEVCRGAACVESSCGQWVAGMSSARPAYVFNNRRECCIHADPLLGTIEPGETHQDVSTVHICSGSLEDFDARVTG